MERKTVDIHFLRFFYLTITLKSLVYECFRLVRYLFSATFTVYRSHCVVLHCHFLRFNVPDEISDRYNITRAVIYGGRKSTGHEGRGVWQLKRAFSETLVRCHRLIDSYRLLLYYVWLFFKKRSNPTFGRPDTFESTGLQRLWFSDRSNVIYYVYINI